MFSPKRFVEGFGFKKPVAWTLHTNEWYRDSNTGDSSNLLLHFYTTYYVSVSKKEERLKRKKVCMLLPQDLWDLGKNDTTYQPHTLILNLSV